MKKPIVGFIIALLVLPAHAYSQYVPDIELTETLETIHFTIHYREDHAIIAQEVAEIAESMYDDAVTFMEYTPQERIEIDIYPSSFTYAYTILQADTSGFSLMLGCPFSTESLGMNPLERKRLVAVGLNIVFLLRMLAIDAEVLKKTHLWLEAGIPQYFASKGENETALIAVHLLRENNNLPSSFDEITAETYANFVYPLSFTVIQYMFDEYGKEKFHTFLHTLEEWDQTKTSRENVDRALLEAFGTTREECEQGWLSYIKNLPAFEEKCDAVQITDSWGFNIPSSWHDDNILYTSLFRISEWSKNLDVFVMNADGSSVKKLTDDVATDCDPKFSPDGTQIAFTSLRDGYANIYVMNADGSHIQQITFEKAMDYMGSWSPDGEKIAFTSGRSGNYDIYIMNADGSHIQQVTTYPGEDGWPVFSPDGQKILFVSDRNGSYDLYTMNVDGTDIQQLTTTPEYENFPQYSPDGEKVVFFSWNGEIGEICTMNSDGTDREVLISQPVFFLNEKIVPYLIGYPVWSPDGKEVAVIIGDDIFTAPVEQHDFTWALVLIAVAGFVGILLWRVVKK
ncbi:MAG: hypothetical protein AYK19_06040 [Theionarchaea archaeon DG-70-1]|nr:MAG: hypothetical protein AYK19_06040 [Theionarchaea archaeon DG-70-1]